MDFQATTPMVTISDMWCSDRLSRCCTRHSCVLHACPIRTQGCWMPCCPTKWTTMATLTPELTHTAGRVRLPWRQPGRFVETGGFFYDKFKNFYFNTNWQKVTVCCLFDSEQQVADLIGADPREIIFTSGATESNNMAIKVLPSTPTLLLAVETLHCHSHSLLWTVWKKKYPENMFLLCLNIAVPSVMTASVIDQLVNTLIGCENSDQWSSFALQGVARFYQTKKRHVITTQTEHKCVLDSCRVLEAEGFKITYLPVQTNGLVDLEVHQLSLERDPQVQTLCQSHGVYSGLCVFCI